MEDKLIVTHRGALTQKYKASGVTKIRAALKALVAADRVRGLRTVVVNLDDPTAMKKYGAKPVTNARDRRANKAAIDKLFTSLAPDYLLILGATDVIPHQDLSNPAFAQDGDDDRWAFGDLPYACDGAYSRDPASFVGPTRVVGRLPDLVAATDPTHLVSLLQTAANWKRRAAKDYAKYFGLSAAVWEGSSLLSLHKIFGNNDQLLLAPPKGPSYPKGELAALSHFINCHGGTAAPEFYGEKDRKQPVSLTSAVAARAISKGTVAAVECCYGAELYDSVTLGIDKPICQAYLERGAYGYFGSTTIAYGPADENGAADLICQFFLLEVLAGASIGRAALMARQAFVAEVAQMDPIDLKTLAQFCLYGDPSVHPVAVAVAAASKGTSTEEGERFRRGERRMRLKDTGESLHDRMPTASKKEVGGRMSATAKTALRNIEKLAGLPPGQTYGTFKVKGGKRSKGSMHKLTAAPLRYFVTIGWPRRAAKDPASHRVAIVAKEQGGKIMGHRIYHER